jgi:ribosomal protein L37AE/L43A
MSERDRPGDHLSNTQFFSYVNMITSALESGSPLPFNPYINCARKGECDLEYVRSMHNFFLRNLNKFQNEPTFKAMASRIYYDSGSTSPYAYLCVLCLIVAAVSAILGNPLLGKLNNFLMVTLASVISAAILFVLAQTSFRPETFFFLTQVKNWGRAIEAHEHGLKGWEFYPLLSCWPADLQKWSDYRLAQALRPAKYADPDCPRCNHNKSVIRMLKELERGWGWECRNCKEEWYGPAILLEPAEQAEL